MTDDNIGFKRFLIKDAVPFGTALPHFVSGYISAYIELVNDVVSKERPLHLDDEAHAKLINKHFFMYVANLSNHYDPHLAQGPYNTSFPSSK